MKAWTTETWVPGAPEEALELLTEPDASARAFESVLAAGALRASVARIGRELEPALA